MKLKCEYLWLDGSQPQELRSKTKVINYPTTDLYVDTDQQYVDVNHLIKQIVYKLKDNLSELPVWNFDGSSTYQAETKNSELLLQPVNVFLNPFDTNSIFVLCEVMNTDMTPHSSNTRNRMVKTVSELDQNTWYGFEQEYTIFDNSTGWPLGWPTNEFPRPQGDYYCSAGSNNVSGRQFVEDHMNLCLEMDISLSGTNAEVMLGQWEYQVGPVSAIEGSDQMWVSRYVMHRLSEKYNYRVTLAPKPFRGSDWNGSGMHVNFSTGYMRSDMENKKSLVIEACKKLEREHASHISVYGIGNEHRLTGSCETSSMDSFKWGIGDRTASIRIPYSIDDTTSGGYLEDRRPASNACPYVVVDRLLRTICSNVCETII